MSTVTLSISQLNELAREKGLSYGAYCARYCSKPTKEMKRAQSKAMDIKALINSRPIINLVDNNWLKVYETIFTDETNKQVAQKLGMENHTVRQFRKRKSPPMQSTAITIAREYNVWIAIGDIYSSDIIVYDEKHIIDDLTSDITKKQALKRGVTESQWIGFQNRQSSPGLAIVNAIGKAVDKKILLG